MSSTMYKLSVIASTQRGGFTRIQAHDAGISDRQLRRHVAEGTVAQVGPNAFRFCGAPLSFKDELAHLMLDVRDPVWASRSTAAALHGFDGFELRRPFHLTVRRERNSRRVGVHVHTATFLPRIDTCMVEGLRATSPVRTLIELARHCSAEQLSAALESMLRDGLASEDLLHRRIVALRRQGRHGVPLLCDVIEGVEIARGGASWLEREFLRLVDRRGLPQPLTQRVLARAGDRSVRVDCEFPGTDVVVELLGYRFHRTPAQLQRDAERYNQLLLAGRRPFQFTYVDVVERARSVMDTLGAALPAAA